MLDNFDNVVSGTKLLVRSDLYSRRMYGCYCVVDDMASLAGTIVTVDRKDSSNTLKIEGMYWIWTPSMFECIIQPKTGLLSLLKESDTNGA